MNTRTTMPAPAKINLHLAVGSRQADGFHPVASIFQAISLHDTVTVELIDSSGIELVCACDCSPEDNTAYKAASLFMDTAGKCSEQHLPGVMISIDKKIPAGSGLGGGSSDAAATLKALSLLIPGAVPDAQLISMAAMVGSDVPFFMGTACARVTGRGEILSSLLPRTDYAVVLVNPGFPIPTRMAYRSLDDSRVLGILEPAHSAIELESELDRLLALFTAAAPEAWAFRNDFFPAMAREYPGLALCRDALLSAGGAYVSMSGSGSCMYGIFPDAGKASDAMVELTSNFNPILSFPLACISDSI